MFSGTSNHVKKPRRALFLGLAGLAACLAIVAAAYGGWLAATPDEESTRQRVGFVLIAVAVVAAVIAILAYVGSRRGSSGSSRIRARP